MSIEKIISNYYWKRRTGGFPRLSIPEMILRDWRERPPEPPDPPDMDKKWRKNLQKQAGRGPVEDGE